jgi:predicted DNA-binding transcriptional regulator AlpA
MTAAVAEAPKPLVPNRLLSAADLAELLSVPERTIRSWQFSGMLPKPIPLGKKLIRWRPGDIRAWLDAQEG